MPAALSQLFHQVGLSLPLFVIIFVGYALIRWGRWPTSITTALTRFVFSLALPAMLFHLMSDFSKLPPVDARLLIAFFGGIFIVFAITLVVARKVFRLDGVAASIFALGCIFSNNVMLGLPIARMAIGEQAVPSVALVLVFNSLILWTLVTASVEWARHGSLSLRGFGTTIISVFRNPLIIAILSGTIIGVLKIPLPDIISSPINMLHNTAVPMALLTLGMGLAEYSIRDGWKMSLSICVFKLAVLPVVVWGLAVALKLPPLETQVIVLQSSIAIGINVYLMARQFNALQAPIASALIISSVLSAFTTPIVLTIMMSIS